MRFFGLIATSMVFTFSGVAHAQSHDLRDCMDAEYGAGNWTERTAIATGTDIGPALDNCFTTIRSTMSTGRGKVIIPPGQWLMTTPPDPSLLSGNLVEGFGSQASIITFNNAGAAAFSFSGASGYSGGGIKGIAILLENNLSPSNTNSYAITMNGDSTTQPDQTVFEDIYISSQAAAGQTVAYWYDGFNAYGADRTSGARGIRIVDINNLQIFNCRNTGVQIYNGIQWSITNLGIYTPASGTNGGDMYVTGLNGNANTWSEKISISRLAIFGNLYLKNTNDVAVEGRVNRLVTDSTATYISGWLRATQTTSGTIGSGSNLTVRN